MPKRIDSRGAARDPLTEAAQVEPCRICAGRLQAAFPGTLLGDVAVTYYLCEDCRSLILPRPHWLERAYAPLPGPDPDVGLLRRTLFIHATLRRMRSVGLLPPHCRSLDFGAGKGILVQLLLDAGFDAWGHEPIAAPLFAQERIAPVLPAGAFDLRTCVEVAE